VTVQATPLTGHLATRLLDYEREAGIDADVVVPLDGSVTAELVLPVVQHVTPVRVIHEAAGRPDAARYREEQSSHFRAADVSCTQFILAAS
jgi:hypothetical protein